MTTAHSETIGSPSPSILRDLVAQNGIFIVTAILVAGPILPIIYQSLIEGPLYQSGQALTLKNYVDLLTSESFHAIILNTLVFATLATLLAQFIGVVTAILVARTDMPGRHIFSEVLIWPLFLSQLLVAFGAVIMYGPAGYITGLVASMLGGQAPWNLYSIGGLALVAGVALAPLSFFYCVTSARAQDATLEQAARSVGAGPVRILFSVTIPLLRPAIIYSAVINFVVALEMLSIPLALGSPVGLKFFTTFLYEEGFEAPVKNYGLVGAGAVMLLAIITVLIILQRKLLQNPNRFVTIGGKAGRVQPLALGAFRWPAFAIVLFYVCATVGAVVFGLVARAFTSILSPYFAPWQALTLDNFLTIWNQPSYFRSIYNTIFISATAAAIGTALVVAVAFIVHRSEYRFRHQLEFVALYPRSMPGILVGMGAFYAMLLVPLLGMLQGTIAILIIVYVMRYLPTGYGAVVPNLMQISRDLDRSARSVGADWWTASTRILLGLLKPALISCFAILFIHFVKEYGAAVFLFGPGSEVIGTTMLSMWVAGYSGPVAALATIQIAITATFLIVVRVIFGVKLYS